MNNNNKPAMKTMKRVVVESSSTPSVSLPKNKAKTMKRKIIIESPSSLSSSPKKTIETHSPEQKEGKIDLKIQQPISNMPSQTKQNTIKPNIRMNEQFIELMEKLADIMLKQGEPFRARAYQKAQETIMAYPEDIVSPNDLKGKPGIGETIMEKLNEYVATGTLQVLEREKNNPINIISEVYGIGPKKATDLVSKGITTIEQLRAKQNEVLNDTQKVGLKYYEDILQRIPRKEIDEYFHIFKTAFDKVKKTSFDDFEIVGSYRRGAETSGDIDVIITSNSSNTFTQFVDILVSRNIILEVLSKGPSKCLVITKIPSSQYARRVDFLFTSKEEYPFSLLYFTGSKIFNTVMRSKALSMGLTMNEHGLYKLEGKKKGDKVEHVFRTEKDIFDYLKLKYISPIERKDGRSVIIIPKKRIVVEESDSDSDSELEAEVGSSFKPDEQTIHFINEFKQKGINVLKQLDENQLSKMVSCANILYRNYKPIMTDNEFDILQDYIAETYPTTQVLQEIGAPVEKNKVRLPYQMASMDKIKPDTNALQKWTQTYKGPYVLSCKLDGVSGLYTTEGIEPQLFTRGDGKIGQNVSHFIRFLRLPKEKGIVIRGEFIIPKQVFESKYKSTFANARNLVSGIINHKTLDEKAKDVCFVAYEVIKPVLSPSKQMELLHNLNVECVLNTNVSTITNELLSQTLVSWRKEYHYEIDGIIVANDKVYERKNGNPEFAFAFKMVLSDQIAEAKVVDVIWTPSKDGYLKPRVQIEPIHLGGVKIEYATGFNGAFIKENNIGIGSLIELIRSGDVIPHIRKVVTPAEHPKMPSVPYKWNNTHIDVLLEDVDGDETVKEKNITGFFKGIGVDGLSGGNVSRIVNAGFDSVPKIIHMSINDFLQVEGFKMTMATKIHTGIQAKLSEASIVVLMSASNIFGRGFSDKKLELIMENYPDILLSEESDEVLVKKVVSIKGMAEKSAKMFVEKIDAFINFIKEIGLEHKLDASSAYSGFVAVDKTHPLFGKSIVMSGFRDSTIQDTLKTVGAKLSTSVSKNTFLVLVKDKEDDTGKIADAKKLGIVLMTPNEFKEKYMT